MGLRRIHNKLYSHTCNVYTHQSQKNKDGSTSTVKVILHENIKCRISKNTQKQLQSNDVNNTAAENLTLFVSDLLDVPAGSIIESAGKVYRSGEPFKYDESHQEIPISMERIV